MNSDRIAGAGQKVRRSSLQNPSSVTQQQYSFQRKGSLTEQGADALMQVGPGRRQSLTEKLSARMKGGEDSLHLG